MKRFVTTSFIALALLVGAAGAAPAAHAVACADTCQASCNANQTPSSDTCAGGEVCCFTPATGTAGVGTGSDAANAAAVTAAQAAQAGNGNGDLTGPKGDTSASYNQVMIWLMELFAWLAGVAMTTLNYAMYYTVVAMGSYVKNLTAIGVTWRILRDIGNIVLIFGFLAAGIAIILNVNMYGWGKKMLPMLLVAAIFLNFSLFLSEAVIDVGNLFAVQFYTQINGGVLPTPATLNNGHGIADTIMAQLGLTSIYGDVTTGANALQIFKGGSPWIIGFMGILLFIILAFVLFSLAFILIVRFIVLIFLIVVAPIGFAGLIVPKLDNTAKLWWSTLFEQTITAPVLLLLLYVALAVITDAHFLTGFGTSQAAEGTGWLGTQINNGLTGFAPLLLSFLIAMGLLLAVVMVSKRMSAAGGGWATKTAGALTFGAAGWAMNRTVGRASYYAKRGLQQSKVFNTVDAMTGRATTRLLNRGATGSFDLRGTGGLGIAGVDAGKPPKDGFAGARDRNIKQHAEAAKQIEQAYKDKGSGRFETRIVTERAAVLASAQKERDEAQKSKDTTKAQLERLKSSSDTSPEHMMALDKAEHDLATTESRLSAAVAKLSAAQAETKKDVGKAANDRMKARISEGKRSYAEGLTKWGNNYWNPVNLVAYGPSTSAAARKIKESLKEPSNEAKFADLAVKLAKEQEEKNAGSPESTKPKEKEEGSGTPPPAESHT